MTKFIAIDFFCGAGGTTCGFTQAGIEVLKGFDIDDTVRETYTRNNPNTIFIEADMSKIKANEIMSGIDRTGNKLIFIACAPCQPFSLLGKGKKRDSRKPLIIHFGEIVKELLPEYIFVENVPGFAKKRNPYFKKFLSILSKSKYTYEWQILDASDYGVPQKRKRFVLVASRVFSKYNKLIKEPSHGTGRTDHVSVRSAISKYPPIRAGQRHKTIPNHVARSVSKKNLKRIQKIPKDGGSRNKLPSDLVLECHKKHGGHSDVYGRMRWDTPSPTLTCKCTSISNGRFGHPKQNRAISAREAAAIQTFPDNYIFYGYFTDMTRHIGNAVPVLFARKIAEGILEYDSGTIQARY